MKKRVMKVIQHQTKTQNNTVKFAPMNLRLHEEKLLCQMYIMCIYFIYVLSIVLMKRFCSTDCNGGHR